MTNTQFINFNIRRAVSVLPRYKISPCIFFHHRWNLLLCLITFGVLMLFLVSHPFTVVSAQDTGRLISDLDWSPDGQRVALGIARWQERDRFGVGYPALVCEPVFGIYLVGATTQAVEYIDLNVSCSLSTVDFNPTGTEIVFTSNTVYGAIDLVAREVRQQVTGGVAYQSIVWHPDGESALLTADIGVAAMTYDMVDSLPRGDFDERDFPSLVLPFLYSIWSPDGNQAASSTADGRIYVWQNGQVRQIFTQHSAPVRRLVWNATTNLIASGDDSGRILVWNPNTGETVRELVSHTGAILDLDWRSDGTQLISTSLDNTLRVWDWPSGETRIVESEQLISAVAYSPDGTELAYGGEVVDPNSIDIEIVPVEVLNPPTHTMDFPPPTTRASTLKRPAALAASGVTNSSYTVNSYFKFDLSGGTVPVQRATLRLYATDGANMGGSLYTIANDYNYQTLSFACAENGVNWINAPTTTRVPPH